MVAKSFIPPARDAVGRVETLLNFFGVSSVAAWEEFWHHRVTAARFKTLGHHDRNGYAVSAWLRRGDATAALIECKPYDDAKFKAALRKLRSLTRQSWPVSRDKLIGILAEAGVALALVPDLQNLGLRGAAYWASKDKAVIILSDRLKEESRFWFALFHEAMHILLHSKKALFIDFEKNDDRNGEEREADEHAANALIPADDLARFRKRYGSVKDSYSAAAIAAFAREIDIDPSLVLARLQHEELVSWGSRLTRELRKPMRFDLAVQGLSAFAGTRLACRWLRPMAEARPVLGKVGGNADQHARPAGATARAAKALPDRSVASCKCQKRGAKSGVNPPHLGVKNPRVS